MMVATNKVNSNMVTGSPSLRMYYLQPGNCHGDHLIVVDCEQLYLYSCSNLVLDSIFSLVDMASDTRVIAS